MKSAIGKPFNKGLLLGLLGLPALALGHYSWVAPESLQAAVGDSVPVVFGWGHHPGEGDTVAADRMASLGHWAPDSTWTGLPLHGRESHTSGPLNAPGSHLLAAQQSRGYWSRTIEGGRRGSLKEYPNATSCSYGNNSSKAIVQVGESDNGADIVSQPLGLPLEIVPQAVPAALAEDQAVRVQVLLHGAPLPEATVTVYREGHQDEDMAATFTTDDEGRAELDLSAGYQWLAQVEATVPFHDQSLCHNHSFNGTLMFAR
ncbi:MAG: DUF4198 domain-containing protein [Halomonadaceae bacterium]|nr:MAG: DUF4198 domain-containing protein [Halomonadaceae bacterium]